MTDFIGTNEQLCNALNHIETRASTGHTDIIVVAAAQSRIVGLEEALARAVQIAENYATAYSEGKPDDLEDRADNMMWGMARDIAALKPKP
jgi:hypothetical protein